MGLRHEEPGENVGPAWRDVWLLMAELNRELKGRCVIAFDLTSGGFPRAVVEITLIRTRGRNDHYTVASVRGSWPTSTSRTMPALLIRLLWQLEDAAAEADTRAGAVPPYAEGVLPLPPHG